MTRSLAAHGGGPAVGLSAEQTKAIQELFAKFDVDEGGKLYLSELTGSTVKVGPRETVSGRAGHAYEYTAVDGRA